MSLNFNDHLVANLTWTVLFQGQEQPLSNLAKRVDSHRWGATAVGFGQRGATDPAVVERFEGREMLRTASCH